jgi:hypothetical protein
MPLPRIYQKGLESAAVLTVWYDRAIRDDRKLTLEDIDETALAAGALAWIWMAEMPVTAAILPPVTAVVATGAVLSAVIGGEEGYYDYVDFLESGPIGWVEKTVDVTVPAIKETVAEEVEDAKIQADFLVRTAQSIWQHRIKPRIPWRIFRQPSFW